MSAALRTQAHEPTPPERRRGPRKDQIRNRARLLETARLAFTSKGPDISVETIARDAGVGATTFYRHFPTKDDLIDALMDQLAEGSGEVGRRAESIEDPWEAFTMVFLHGCVLDDSDLLLFESLCRTTPHAAQRGHRIGTQLVEPVLGRARAAGLLSTDVSADDIATFMRMTETGTRQQRDTAKRLMLAGLHQQPAEA
ncbi:TetR family transcriptional regulator [Streptomyces sp. GMY02]|uniref:TetR/AcrR family transcriptional regulator n=1 Tax=Streptomyces sp. GMY02 TaxID=1333528 RepID=UPI001C2C6048|nr:TetR family transcriptional regulator [Streptomyces sp. GMY02]QXE38415.1 TetR family transcriptional regulator [Streptomyces sp. GMY02]